MRRRSPLLLLVSLLLLAPLAGADEFRDAKKQLEAAFRPDVDAATRLQAVVALGVFDTKDAAKALVDAIGRDDYLVAPMVARKAEVDAELEKLLAGKILDKERTFPEATLAKINALKAEAATLQEELDAEFKVLAAIQDALCRARDPDAIQWLGRDALLHEKPWKAREIVAAALTEIGTPEAGGYLVKGLRDKDDRVRVRVAVGIGKLKVKDALDDLLHMLKDKAWAIRSAAIQALGDIGEKGAVGPLIDQIEKEDGRLREDCAEALSKLTGQRFGQVPESWRRWWEQHKDEYGGDSGKALGGHPPDKGGDPGKGYYGLPILTNRAIFILDVSGSMSKSSKDAGRDPANGELSKIDVAKKELSRVLKEFDPKGRFDVIIFNDAIQKWKDGMVPATKANKASAVAFVENLTAASSTNIYDAMEAAFRIAGMGVTDRNYEPAADTIFLLSDGSPTKPDGSLDDWMKIIRACREWNRLKRVKIHTIGVGGHNVAFMQMLASENGGDYVAR